MTPPDEWQSRTISSPWSASPPTTCWTAATSSGRPVRGSSVPPTLGRATWYVWWPARESTDRNSSQTLGSCQEPGTMTMVGLVAAAMAETAERAKTKVREREGNMMAGGFSFC
jgi:hypothetical protein